MFVLEKVMGLTEARVLKDGRSVAVIIAQGRKDSRRWRATLTGDHRWIIDSPLMDSQAAAYHWVIDRVGEDAGRCPECG